MRQACIAVVGALTLCLAAPAQAQDVEPGSLSGWGIIRRQWRQAAQSAGRTDWPDPGDGVPGTQGILTFDVRNADLTLITTRSFGLDRLLDEARRIARAIGLPETDYITLNARKSAGVDLEFNDYLQRDAQSCSITHDLSRLRQALEQSDLPRPILLGIDATDASRVTLSSVGVDHVRKGRTFLDLTDISPNSRLRFEVRRTATGLAVGAFFGLVLLATLVPAFTALRARTNPAEETLPPAPTSPAEVQKRYDRAGPWWICPLVLGLGIPLLLGNTRLLQEAYVSWSLLLPFRPDWVVFGSAMVMILCSGLVGLKKSLALRSAKRDQPSPESVNPELPGPFLGVIKVALGGLLLLGGLVVFFPVYTPEAALVRRNVALGVCFILPVAMGVAFYRGMRAERETLREGLWFELVHEMARRAGVRVRHVVLLRSKMPNAYASILGTVGLTTRLLSDFTPDEVRAVVCHELGHLKLGHPRRNLVVSLSCTILLLSLFWGADAAFGHRLPDGTRMLLRGPFLVVFLLPILRMALVGQGMRRREIEADRLAAEWVGDPDLVIRALERLHYLAESPGRLKPADEALASHPSLVYRVDALRALKPRMIPTSDP